MWYTECGKDGDVVLSSRVRLARNIKGIPFPARADEKQQEEVIEKCKEALLDKKSPYHKTMYYIDLGAMEDFEKQALAERHLMSPQMLEHDKKRGLLLSNDNAISIMLNEEDHIRIQTMAPGFEIDRCFAEANAVDDLIAGSVAIAFDEQYGYLTCCPTTVGTGMRASVMLHLPAMTMSGTLSSISNSLSQLGITIRGIYGEGSKALGNIYQISNQLTLGETEEDIIDKFKQIVADVVEKERELRQRIYEAEKFSFEDKLMRSFGVLKFAVAMSSDEAMKRLSDLRFSINLGLIKEVSLETVNRLTYDVMPANIIQKYNIHDAKERDLKRAEIIKEALEKTS